MFTVRRYPSNSASVDSRSVSGDRTEAARADAAVKTSAACVAWPGAASGLFSVRAGMRRPRVVEVVMTGLSHRAFGGARPLF